MRHFTAIKLVTLLAAFLVAAELWAQAEQTPESLLEETATEKIAAEDAEDAEHAESEAEPETQSREVEFSEDNFRRSMELRDRELQRSVDLTTGTYSHQTGVQTLDELPEASQKHLRNQLREVILRQGPWTPEEAGKAYPYVPSAAAERDGALRSREQVAWGDLVENYHEREAAIHAASAGREAASTGAREPGGPGRDSGGQESADGAEDRKAGRAAALTQMLESGAASGAAQAAEAAPSTAGVSQNAMEYLQERQQLPPQTAAASSDERQAEAGEGESRGEESRDIDLDSEGVIAIRDLERIELEPEEEQED